MMEFVKHKDFFYRDVGSSDAWCRYCFVPARDEVALFVLQQPFDGWPKPYDEVFTEDDVSIGMVIGSDVDNCIKQLSNPTFDKYITDSDIVARVKHLLRGGDLLTNWRAATRERRKKYLAAYPENYPFSEELCRVLKEQGFDGDEVIRLEA